MTNASESSANNSPLEKRIAELVAINDEIKSLLRNTLRNVPAVFRADVAAELRAAAAKLESTDTPVIATVPNAPAKIRGGFTPPDFEPSELEDSHKLSVREKMLEHFRSNDNVPMTISELSEVLGIPIGSIQAILLKRPYGQFKVTGKKHTGKAPASLWQATEDGIEGRENREAENPQLEFPA